MSPDFNHLPSQTELVLLDRDGVINRESSQFVKSADEWQALPGSIDAIVTLQRRFTVAVATNQSGVGRQLITLASLDAMHSKMNRAIEAAGGQALDVFFCPHLPDAGCTCRKPLTGLIDAAADKYNKQPSQILVVGDSLRDLQAGLAAGTEVALVLTGNGQTTATDPIAHSLRYVFDDLGALASNNSN